jgi:hypothetical protein
MGGPYIRRHQPRLQYAEVGGKFIVNNEHVNPFVGRRVWREFPKAQVHVIPRGHRRQARHPKLPRFLATQKVPY